MLSPRPAYIERRQSCARRKSVEAVLSSERSTPDRAAPCLVAVWLLSKLKVTEYMSTTEHGPPRGPPSGGDNVPRSSGQCLSLRLRYTRSQRHSCLPGYPDTVMPFNKSSSNIQMLDKCRQQQIFIIICCCQPLPSTQYIEMLPMNNHQFYRRTCKGSGQHTQ